jgi:plasmid stability protein
MGALTIRNIDDAVVAAIKRRAGERGISMEEEIRRMLSVTYPSADQQARGKEWARQQLERLKRGELPKADRSSVDEIRAMREERSEQLADRSGKHSGPHR